MADFNGTLRYDLGQPIGDLLDVVDSVVNKEDLSATIHLAEDRMANHLFVKAADSCFNREPIFRRSFQIGNIAHP